MEILNNTVIITCERSMSPTGLILRIPGKMLYDLYNKGKRCICKTESKMDFIFEIISAYMEPGLSTFFLHLKDQKNRLLQSKVKEVIQCHLSHRTAPSTF